MLKEKEESAGWRWSEVLLGVWPWAGVLKMSLVELGTPDTCIELLRAMLLVTSHGIGCEDAK